MNTKQAIISVRQLARLLEVERACIAADEDVQSFLTDSRSLTSPIGTVFVALVTPSGDGHLYIEDLYRRGVRSFVVQQPLEQWRSSCPEANILQVRSTLWGLQRMAAEHRLRYGLPVVGITGSNGKTIVKEYLNTLLQDRYHICRSPRSYNSQIGVPLSVLQLDEACTLGIFEAGISAPGEMTPLAQIIAPSIGVLTSLGSAHAEQFPSQRALLSEKMQLLEQAQRVVAPLDAPYVAEELTARSLWEKVVGWSRRDERAALRLIQEERDAAHTRLKVSLVGQELSLTIPMADKASVENVMTALCVVFALEGALSEEVLQRLSLLSTPEMRLQIKESYRGNTLINDAYSNDLDALRIALDVLRRRAGAVGAETVAILSDVEQSALPKGELYRQVAQLLEEFRVQRVYAVGDQIRALEQMERGFALSCYASPQELLERSDLYSLSSACILIKGARRYGFERIYAELSRLEHQTTLEVDLSAVRHNLAYYRSLLPAGQAVMCMIKANGYGIGAFELAKTLEEARVDFLAVAAADEGKQLRMGGIKSRIVVMNPDWGNMDTLVRHQLEPEIYSLELLREVVHSSKRMPQDSFPIHLKIDSGMHRLGLRQEELGVALDLIVSSPAVRVASVFSHLASADAAAYDDFTAGQAAYLQQMYGQAVSVLGYRPLLHLLNTAGIARFASHYAFDMVRLGLGLYGISPVSDGQLLRPVCQLSSTILQVKEIPEGDPVGYGCADVALRPTRLAVVPIGYADGLRRSLGRGRWEMLVGERLCPTIGKICMDACMLDVTDVPEVKAGDRVVVFGGAARSVEQMAVELDTIPYEVLTTLSPRIQRLYVQD